MEGIVFQKSRAGTPQGGVISPLLANIALHGLEYGTKAALKMDLFNYKKQVYVHAFPAQLLSDMPMTLL